MNQFAPNHGILRWLDPFLSTIPRQIMLRPIGQNPSKEQGLFQCMLQYKQEEIIYKPILSIMLKDK